jgi:hypothetical protein
LDHCPDVPGVKYMHGCPDTDAPEEPKTTDDTQKLLNGEAVMVPSAFGNYVVTKKWLRLKNNCYEYSDYEKRAYKSVSTKETVEKLNAFYNLQVPLPQQNPQTPKGPVVPKPPKEKGLTEAQIARIAQLKQKQKTTALTREELNELKELETIK